MKCPVRFFTFRSLVGLYALLFDPGSCVQVKLIDMTVGATTTPGLGVFARTRIVKDQILWSMGCIFGKEIPPESAYCWDDFSAYKAEDTQQAGCVLVGPGRLLNHSCHPNVIVSAPVACVPANLMSHQLTETHSDVFDSPSLFCTVSRDIEEGEQLFLHYGKDYWSGECPCHVCQDSSEIPSVRHTYEFKNCVGS